MEMLGRSPGAIGIGEGDANMQRYETKTNEDAAMLE
jgi:hypothetical protein